MPNKKWFSVWIVESDLEWLNAKSEELGISRSELIRRFIAENKSK